MISSRLIWHGDKITAQIKADEKRKISRAVMEWARHAIQRMGNPSPPASAPGEYPGKRSGHLRRNLTWEVQETKDGFAGRAGTNVKYGKYLQDGTTNKDGSQLMASRPWFSLTNSGMFSRIREILTKPMGT